MKTYTNNTLQITITNYDGQARLKIDNELQNNNYTINGTGTIQSSFNTNRAGNHSVTVLLDNEYTLNKVRNNYFIVYQNEQVKSFSYTMANTTATIIHEETTLSMHFVFKEFTNESINDIPVQIVTNDGTILAQANIFNSETDLLVTIIGTELSLVIKAVKESFVHEEIIPLNLTIYKLLTSNLQDSYSYTSPTTLKVDFTEKYFPKNDQFTIQSQLLEGTTIVKENTTMGRSMQVQITANGEYELVLEVSGYHYINQTFTTHIKMKKLFDISNTSLITAIGVVVAIPTVIVAMTFVKRKKSNI